MPPSARIMHLRLGSTQLLNCVRVCIYIFCVLRVTHAYALPLFRSTNDFFFYKKSVRAHMSICVTAKAVKGPRNWSHVCVCACIWVYIYVYVYVYVYVCICMYIHVYIYA